jgi:hypothetical protein
LTGRSNKRAGCDRDSHDGSSSCRPFRAWLSCILWAGRFAFARGLPAGVRRHWKNLDEQAKKELKQGISDGSLSY